MSDNPDSTARVFPRPSASAEGVGTMESSRIRVPVGVKVGRIVGGSITRLDTANDTETSVALALFRASATANGDFIDRAAVSIETSGEEEGQAHFQYTTPLEFSSSQKGVWVTLKNASSSDEDYLIELDIIPGVAWPEDM